MSKSKSIMNRDRCKGCGYCIEACPKKALSFSDYITDKGYTAAQIDESLCIGCGACYRVCPDYVFEIVEITE